MSYIYFLQPCYGTLIENMILLHILSDVDQLVSVEDLVKNKLSLKIQIFD